MSAPLSTFYAGWDRFNDELAAIIAGLDRDQLALRAVPAMWSVRQHAGHIVGVRAWWFNAWMDAGGEDLARLIDFDEGEEAERRDAPAIAAELRSSWASVASALDGWTEADLAERFQRPEPNEHGERPWRTRQWIIWHIVEHDIHHAGEISQILGMHGLTGLDV
jgi:uncharacterized damage-inducible protein DinB